MDFFTSFSSQKILIPTLQRDYVQGASEEVIVPFLDCLLSNEDVDLNYIYGYTEDYAFVPVDGQQRLITLWLLHLYVWSSIESNPFTISLSFQTREFANDFCQKLSKNIRSIILRLKTESPTAEESNSVLSFDEAVVDSCWFISSWKKNTTIANMLRTLKYIHSKIGNRDIRTIYSRLFTSPAGISFAFLKMTEENGLDDDIYIKMNGRGRPLSAFENLKSWMDKRVESLSFGNRWKIYMDNRWTHLFWSNRNIGQEHPEEIDDEQLHLFCNLLYLFHTKFSYLVENQVNNTNFREELLEYLGITDYNAATEEIIKEIFSCFANGRLPSLIWIERLNLMPDSFFRFAFASLNLLSERSKEINESGLYFGENETSSTAVYNLSMKEATITRSLPILYSILRYRTGSLTDFYEWMRTLRNLILNYNEGGTTLAKMMIGIDILSRKAKREDIFDALHRNTFSDSQFACLKTSFSRQLDEEILKASPKYINFRLLFADMENMRFFSGRIHVLFRFLDDSELTAENIENTIYLLKNIFDGGNSGISRTYDDNYYFRRILMTYGWYGFLRNNCWCFCNGLEEWRAYVRNVEEVPISLVAFSKDFAPQKYDKTQLFAAIKDTVEEISNQKPSEVLGNEEPMTRYYFIHYPGVWDFMKTMRAKRNGDYNVVLNKQNSNNTNQMELRTYSLYFDYLGTPEKFISWEINIWPGHGASCFYFQKRKVFQDGEEYTIAMDVFFRGIHSERNSEDCYGLNIFIRNNSDEDLIESKRKHELLKAAYWDLFVEIGLTNITNDYRFSNSQDLSRARVIEKIDRLLIEV